MRCAFIRKLRLKVTLSTCQSQAYFHYITTPAPTSFGILASEFIKGAGAQMKYTSPSCANLKISRFHLTDEP